MMINPRFGEVWETRRVFQGAVGNAARFPWPRRLSAAVGSEPELRPRFVSKSLTRSETPRKIEGVPILLGEAPKDGNGSRGQFESPNPGLANGFVLFENGIPSIQVHVLVPA